MLCSCSFKLLVSPHSIAQATGLPMKIDKMTLEKTNCLFARILVDIDLANPLPEKVLAKRRSLNFFCRYCL